MANQNASQNLDDDVRNQSGETSSEDDMNDFGRKGGKATQENRDSQEYSEENDTRTTT